jgi:orotate phosphoribosyltransferase
MPDLIQALERIGAIQFGQFEQAPGIFAPMIIRLGLLPSYPAVLKALAEEMAPLVHIEGVTHLLAMPDAVPLGVAISLAAGIPLVYPAAGDPKHIEGAYDFNVPTVLLSDVLRDPTAEAAMIQHVKGLGLDVKAVVTVVDFEQEKGALEAPICPWRTIQVVLDGVKELTPAMREVVRNWLMTVRQDC